LKGHLSGGSFERSFNKHTPKISSHYDNPFKITAAQMPKFHALSIIQDQLRGSDINMIPCVCMIVRV